MKLIHLVATVIVLCNASSPSLAQNNNESVNKILKSHVAALAAPDMYGRGYVRNGVGIAADYIEHQFRMLHMQPVPGKRSFRQRYKFNVNTFPNKMQLTINGKQLIAGRDFLVDAASPSYQKANMPVTTKDLATITTQQEWEKEKLQLHPDKIWLLQNADSMCKTLGMRLRSLPASLGKGCYILPVSTKQSWTVSQHTMPATVFYVYDSVLPTNITSADVAVKNHLKKKAKNHNIIATIPGTVKDSFIVFSAHYDHLGIMGGEATFAGASDNASGTAMMLYLASYFTAHTPKYTMIFIAFSGEEAGLLGSKYFIEHPTFAINNIKFVANVDIMGDATDGVTVVNATEFPKQFSVLTNINEQKHYLPAVKSRGKAANSDHYVFSERGIPAFFLYSNGGKGYYHDIFDKPDAITLNNVANVAQLLIDFAQQL